MAFTRNYDVLRMLCMGVTTSLDKFQSTLPIKIWYLKDTSGNISYNHTSAYYDYGIYNYSGHSTISPLREWRRETQSNCGRNSIIVGTCGDAESYDDYKISTFNTQYVSTLSNYNTNGNITYNTENKTCDNTITVSLLNNSGTSQTIREVGVIFNDTLLIYRKVLETPLIVPIDGYFKVSFNYSVPIPEILISQDNT